MNAKPSLFVTREILNQASTLISKNTGQPVREGVELLLKNDLSRGASPESRPSHSVDAGELLQKGLTILANSPFDALDIPLSSQTLDVRKAYKKMALKYHPDKNPHTTPLFQAMHAAHERLSDRNNRKEEQLKQERAAAAARAAAKPPPGPQPQQQRSGYGYQPHGARAAAQQSTHESEKDYKKSYHRAAPSGSNQSTPHSSNRQYHFDYKNNDCNDSTTSASGRAHYKFSDAQRRARMREQMRRQQDHLRARDMRKEGSSRDERDKRHWEEGRRRETEAAAKRAADRRRKGGYGERESQCDREPPFHEQSGHGFGMGNEGKDRKKKQSATDATSPSKHASQNRTPGEHAHHNAPTGGGAGKGLYGSFAPGDHATTQPLPYPEGVVVAAVDATTVQVQWAPYTEPTIYSKNPAPPCHSAEDVKTQLSWKLCAGSGGQGKEEDWQVAGVLISGQRVRKKNLLEGENYKFRVRFVVPASTSTRGKGSGGSSSDKGPWSASTAVKLPTKRRSFRHSESTPTVANKDSSHHQQQQQHRQRARAQAQRHSKLAAEDDEEAEEVGEDEEMAKILSESAKLAWAQQQRHGGKGEGAAEGGGEGQEFFKRHFSRAASPPAEEVLSDNDDNKSAASARGTEAKRRNNHASKQPSTGPADSGDSIDEYQLFPPCTHKGPGRYVHSVHSKARVGAAIIGYVSSHKNVVAKKRIGDWMQVQIHWASSSAMAAKKKKSRRGNSSEDELEWGWTRSRTTNEETGQEHLFLYPITTPAVRSEQPGMEWDQDEDEAYDHFDCAGGYGGAAPQVDVWYEQHDDNGYAYFYNATTGESQWEAPEWVEEKDDESGASYFVKLNKCDASPLASTWSKPQSFARIIRRNN